MKPIVLKFNNRTEFLGVSLLRNANDITPASHYIALREGDLNI